MSVLPSSLSLADLPVTDAQRQVANTSCNSEEQSQFVSPGVGEFPYHDFLTPEYSSENPYSEASPYNSSSVEDLLSDTHASAGQMIDEQLEPAAPSAIVYTDPDACWTTGSSLDSQYMGPLRQKQLSSPHPTMTPSPPVPARNMNMADPAFDTRFARAKPQLDLDQMRRHPNLQARTPPEAQIALSDSDDHRANFRALAQAASPVVTVSLHTRGDSPARLRQPIARTSSKRSAASRSSELLSPEEPHFSHDSQVSGPTPAPDSMFAEHGGHDHHRSSPARRGLSPDQRAEGEVPSLNDQTETRKVDEKNVEVENWLAKSETGSQAGEDEYNKPTRRRASKGSHSRSRSHGQSQNLSPPRNFDDSHIPGPGVLLNEDSEDGQSIDESADAASDLSDSPVAEPETTMSQSHADELPLDVVTGSDDPLPRQFISPWRDGQKVNLDPESKEQPPSSNAAIYRFDLMAAKFETASRAATWGTRRRLSESEISSIIEGSGLRHLSLSKKRERGSSFMSKLKIRRIPSSSKKKKSPSQSPPKTPEPNKAIPDAETSGIQRIASFGKSKSPSRYAGNALRTVASHISASSRSTPAPPESKGPFGGLSGLKRNRSRSEVPTNGQKGAPSPGLTALFTKLGGPPAPALASPMQQRRELLPVSSQDLGADDDHDDEEEEDEYELSDERGVRMDLDVRVESIFPTVEGFRTHALHLNPRLHPFLAERIAQEQVRRYKKLIESRVKHARAVHIQGHCSSGEHCIELGGKATLLPPRTNARDPDSKHAQFQIPGQEQTEEDDALLAEGLVTPALFPSGIPTPPVKQLPAEFECPLCFKVKKFLKPSDWTKHVHEDIQPFSCTFANCPEPKSFKRKADWVRHENERHRHLEWWQCNIQDCTHICYRKDNFVQHLVREHKLPEPKLKIRGSGSSKFKRIDANMGKSDQVWNLLEVCHHDNQARPRNEICKFCGNICNTWKKVSSHLGKHMEQIALPVLKLVDERDVSPDTVISPLEPSNRTGPQIQRTSFPGSMVANYERQNLSPYPPSVSSLYQDSSAGLSPIPGSDYGSQIHQFRRMQAASQSPQNVPLSHDMVVAGGTAHGQLAYNHYGGEGMIQGVPISNATYPPFQQPPHHPPPHLYQPVAQTHPAPHYPLHVASGPFQLASTESAMYASPVDTRGYKQEYMPSVGQYHDIAMEPASEADYTNLHPLVPHAIGNGNSYQQRPVQGFTGHHHPTDGSTGYHY